MLAVLAHLLLPGYAALHDAVAHADHPHAASADQAAEPHGHPADAAPGGEHRPAEDREPPCGSCHLIGTLGHATPLPSAGEAAAADLSVRASLLVPACSRLSLDPAATPASPRGPPTLL